MYVCVECCRVEKRVSFYKLWTDRIERTTNADYYDDDVAIATNAAAAAVAIAADDNNDDNLKI